MPLPQTPNYYGDARNLPLAEHVKGYPLEADARAKQRDLAEQRRAHETAVNEATQEWQRRFEAVDAKVQRLAKTGSREDAAAVLGEFL